MRRPTPYRIIKPARGIPYVLYDTALASMAYGQTPVLGDLFNDVMSAVVPGWSQRPDWMKKIQIKPDPAKLFQQAAKVVPPERVGQVVEQANRAGLNLWYRTPAGAVPITPETAQGLYSGYGVMTQVKGALETIPWWVYLVGGGLLLFVVLQRR